MFIFLLPSRSCVWIRLHQCTRPCNNLINSGMPVSVEDSFDELILFSINLLSYPHLSNDYSNLFIYLSFHLFIFHLFVSLSTSNSFIIYLYTHHYISIFLSLYPSIYSLIYPSIYLSIYVSIYISVDLSSHICLYSKKYISIIYSSVYLSI